MAEVNGTETTKKKSKPKVTKKYFEEGAGRVTDEDVRTVTEKADEIEDKFKSDRLLGRYIEDGRLLISMVKDYWNGNYKNVPWFTIAAAVFSLLYVLNPLDIIPDFIPLIGWIDDIAVITIAVKMIEKDLQTYKSWKLNPEETDGGYAEEVE